MIDSEHPQNEVSESEWKSRRDAMNGKINWRKIFQMTTILKFIYSTKS